MSEVEPALARTGRRKIVRAVSISLLVAILFSFTLYLSSPNLRVWLSNLFSFTAPYGTAGPVHLEHGTPWGTVTIDGKRVDAANIEMNFGELSLSSGAHHLVYTAALFPTLDCVISGEVQSSDTCPLIRNPDSFERNVILRGPGRIIDLGATPERLRPPDLDALVSAIDLQVIPLARFDYVAVGEPYRTSADTIATATTDMAAILNYTLNDDSSRAPPPGWDATCVGVCLNTARVVKGQDDAPAWGIDAHIAIQWAFRGDEGVAEVAAPAPKSVVPDEIIGFYVHLEGGRWLARLQDALSRAPICSVALRQVQDAGVQFASNVQAQVITAKNPARGCVISGLSPSPNSVAMRFLYRFGVILALDQATHDHLPALLQATPAEQAIAAEIERDAGQGGA
jgi:hypothetical protein